MLRTRGFLHITYVLYHHLDKVSGTKKANCLSVYLSLMKYCWKSNDYKAGLRHSTIQKDTGLSRTTIHRTLQTLTKLNIISTIKGRSGKTYSINNKFIKYETGLFQKYTSNVSNVKTLVETIDTLNNSIIDKIIGKNKGNLDNIINELATLPLPDLKGDTKNVYYCKLAIERKEELARQKNLIDPKIIQKELKKISKETNVRYKEKRDWNIRNGIKPWEK